MLSRVFMFHSISSGVWTDTISQAFSATEHQFHLKDGFGYLTKLTRLENDNLNVGLFVFFLLNNILLFCYKSWKKWFSENKSSFVSNLNVKDTR